MDTLDEYKARGFGVDQLIEIEEGLKSGVDVSIYAKLEFVSIQMRQIRLGLEEGLSVDIYAKADYDWFQMEEIRKGLLNNVKVSIYANPAISYDRMRQIRKGLQVNIDLSPYKHLAPGVLRVLRRAIVDKVSIISYISEGYDESQLDEIRIALSKGLNLAPYLNKQFRGIGIREIAAGLCSNIDVSLYAKTDYNWRQMREIRLGLENRIDVKTYINPLYDWEQMQEIRLGLMHGVEIVSFRSLMFPGCEMREKRLALEKEVEERQKHWQEWSNKSEPVKRINEYEDFSIVVSQDEMEVAFVPKGKPHPISKGIIDDALETYGISLGIDDLAVSHLVNGDWKTKQLVVARGEYPVDGTDGHYEFFFSIEVARTPKKLPDGSVDYHDIEWFEIVRKGEKIAEYHPAVQGKDGYTVFGELIPSKRGVELPVLTGTGFGVDKAGNVYFAEKDGIVSLTEKTIDIKNLLVLKDVSLATGNIKFDGDVYVKGNVFSGMKIENTGDLVIDGYVEKVNIECAGSVILHQGINSSGEGLVRAGGDVIGTFFESANIKAGGCIRANYSMNSILYAEESILINGRKGSLAGGVASAEAGVEVFDLGNKASVMTTVRLGVHDTLSEKLEKVNAHIQTVHEELAALNRAYEEFQKKYPPEIRNANPMFLKIESAIYTKELQSNELNKAKEKLEKKLGETENAEVLVKGTLYDGVIVFIGEDKMTSKTIKQVRIKRKNNHIGMFAL